MVVTLMKWHKRRQYTQPHFTVCPLDGCEW